MKTQDLFFKCWFLSTNIECIALLVSLAFVLCTVALLVVKVYISPIFNTVLIDSICSLMFCSDIFDILAVAVICVTIDKVVHSFCVIFKKPPISWDRRQSIHYFQINRWCTKPIRWNSCSLFWIFSWPSLYQSSTSIPSINTTTFNNSS